LRQLRQGLFEERTLSVRVQVEAGSVTLLTLDAAI
jgi:hypothetical protein